MYKVFIALLVMCLLLSGCAKADIPVETTLPAESSWVSLGSFVISGDTIQFSDTELQMAGVVSDTLSAVDEKAQFAVSEKIMGIFPFAGILALSFPNEVPQKIIYYDNDYDGLEPTHECVVDTPKAQTLLTVKGYTPSSSSLIPFGTRKLRIVCQYPDRTVEYFLVLEHFSVLLSA